MRNVCDKTPSGLLQRVYLICHFIEALAKLANFIVAGDIHPCFVFAAGETIYSVVHVHYRLCHAACYVRYRKNGQYYRNAGRKQNIKVYFADGIVCAAHVRMEKHCAYNFAFGGGYLPAERHYGDIAGSKPIRAYIYFAIAHYYCRCVRAKICIAKRVPLCFVQFVAQYHLTECRIYEIELKHCVVLAHGSSQRILCNGALFGVHILGNYNAVYFGGFTPELVFIFCHVLAFEHSAYGDAQKEYYQQYYG